MVKNADMIKYYFPFLCFFLVVSCATVKDKYKNSEYRENISTQKKVAHTFYLIGDAGLSPKNGLNNTLKQFKTTLTKADQNSTAIFLGDNIYPSGLPDKKKDKKGYKNATSQLDAQIAALKEFSGKPIFIPGNHDWYANGLKGLERQQDYVQEKLKSKKVFYPKDGCPIQKIDISEDIVVIAVDTEWFLTDWDKHPTMNDECEIKDRESFFLELEGLIKKNENKTTLIATHHPMLTYGEHGGHFSFKRSIFPIKSKIPLPILGTFINVLRRTSGASIEDIQNKKYTELQSRLITLAQYSKKVILVSGHEHSLQYIVENNTPQIVSGSGAKKGATRLLNGSEFSTGKNGYGVLQVYTDGSSRVRFYGVSNKKEEEFLFTSEVLPEDVKENANWVESEFPDKIKASIYTKKEVEKGKLFKWLWGTRYRELYAKEITAPTVNLDTLFGGVKVIRKGGGHQSKSLRLVNAEGKEYVMRDLRKSAQVYLQAMAFKNQYVVDEIKDTYTEQLLEDFYTGAHPYAPFVVGKLSDAVGVFHTNPRLFYVPKQEAIKDYVPEFGDGLYMIEERTDDGHGDQKSFGYANKMISTDDLLKKLRMDEKYSIDTTAYVRARLFDMTVGDWDRHVDQWRWAEFKEKDSDKVMYKPVPRDRDQVFSIMGDGALMNIITRITPSLSLMEGFNEEIRSVKGFNGSPMTFALDVALLSETKLKTWLSQAEYIQKRLNGKVVDEALKEFPVEIRGLHDAILKKTLLSRLQALKETAKEYYGLVNKFSIIKGTDKDDYFTITGIAKGKTKVEAHRIKNGKKAEVFFSKVFDKKITKEIWIYGLDDDDFFEVINVKNGVKKIRIIGGQNNDNYNVKNSKGVYVYDQAAKKNTFDNAKTAHVNRSNNYETNTYQPIKLKRSTNQVLPAIGGNPDDGLLIGVSNIYTLYGFLQNPFTQRHSINGAFYFATRGFDIGYKGEFASVIGNANLEVGVKFTSPNFSINFFDYGNNTQNFDDDLGLDYNRVKLQINSFSSALVWRGDMGSVVRAGFDYTSIEIEETEDRFINEYIDASEIDNDKDFFSIEGQYAYKNTDNNAFPTMGMAVGLTAGYTFSVDGMGKNVGYIKPSFSIDYKLVPSGKLVLASKWKAHLNFSDTFEIYQAASIGGTDGLRGFRNQRFTGRKAYYQNTDLRYNLKRIKTGVLPMSFGFFAGFDYGRVWLTDESSNRWHTSKGGGFFLNGADIVSARVALFNSDDGFRFSFGLGFGF